MAFQIERGRRWLIGAVAVATVLGPIGVLAPVGALAKSMTAQEGGADHTSALEARRVDSVPTPKLVWDDCAPGLQCSGVRLPLDYDEPNGAKTKVVMVRRPARDQAHRIGTLFVNPGGPGGSGSGFAGGAPGFFSPALLDRFDIVGFDPRGVQFSDPVKCFTDTAQRAKVLKGFEAWFPMGMVEERALIATAESLGAGCSSVGRPISASMSTAEVARDMDVLRRAVGDSKLTFAGFSYGSYLGQVYANRFPDRVRAVAIDGVLDPVAWAGTPATAARPQWDRLRSADGASKALHEILRLCDQAGEQKCKSAPGDPVANYDLVANRLKKTPLTLSDYPVKFTYAALVGRTLTALYSPKGYEAIDLKLSDLMILTQPAGAGPRVTTAQRSKVMSAFVARLQDEDAISARVAVSPEALWSVSCTDGVSPPDASARQLATVAAAADKRAKYFGRLRAWMSAPCASRTWTARDEDAYRGPFNRRTAAPILVVGNTWDPATNYEGAVKAASLLPNSRLLSSDSWGHLAYGSSQCVTSAIDTYLLTQVVPPRGTNCHGDAQPFQDSTVSVPPVAPPS